MRKKTTLIALTLIIVLALALRAYGANRTLVNDEVVWASSARNLANSGEPLQYLQCGEPVYFYWHPPFGLAVYSAVASFSTENFAFRMLPIAFGIGTIVITYFLGRELYSKKVGLLAAFLMALSHYHILYSQNVDIDGGFLAFFNAAAVLFFVMYKKQNSRKHLYLSILFIAASMFTKFSGFLPIAAMLAYSYLHDKKCFRKDAGILLAAAAASILPVLLYAGVTGDMNYFNGPIEYAFFTIFERAGERTLGQIIYNKAFYLSTVTWMLTPFLTAILLLALARLKRDKRYMLLATWSLLTYFLFFLSFNLDIQRYYAAALAPVFILIAAIATDRIRLQNRTVIISALAALAVAVFAVLLGLNDLQGYHNPINLVYMYILAAALLLAPLRKYKAPLLIGAFAGLSLYMLFSGGSWHAIQSDTVDALRKNAVDFGFDYKELWGNKDVEYAMTPKDKVVDYCFPRPDKEFLRKNNATQLSFYHFTDEEGLKSIAESCIKKGEIHKNNHLVAITCEFDANV